MRYSHMQPIGDRRAWVHRQLPAVPVAFGLSESEFQEQLDLERRLAFQGVTTSVLAQAE